ncbi:CE1759 family FMN reductase [Streptomyces sp. NPDC005908]|uniref:CE1759 family FMN reductase n=1 Tax=unclassified Streptomyces TaxID=2593676 RepID=UPI0011A479DA|nr:CE1759 family FMN reductase [Streptomyces sp. T12]TWD14855.1 FMN reductase [Streptomyces sp. T12]
MRIVVVSAGLSVPSSTRLLGDRLAAVAAPAATAPEPGRADVRVIELRDLAVEIAHTFTNGFPGPALAEAFDAVTGADGLIVVTPVFSASYSGLFKSFFDALSSTDADALAGTPVLIAATGGSARHSLVLDHALRPLFAYLRAVVVPTGVYAASEDWGAEGLDGRIARAAGELAALMSATSATRSFPRQTPAAGRPSPVASGSKPWPGGPAARGPGAVNGHPSPGPAAVPGDAGARQAPTGQEPGRQGAGVGAPLPKKDTFESVTPFEERLAALRPGG